MTHPREGNGNNNSLAADTCSGWSLLCLLVYGDRRVGSTTHLMWWGNLIELWFWERFRRRMWRERKRGIVRGRGAPVFPNFFFSRWLIADITPSLSLSLSMCATLPSSSLIISRYYAHNSDLLSVLCELYCGGVTAYALLDSWSLGRPRETRSRPVNEESGESTEDKKTVDLRFTIV